MAVQPSTPLFATGVWLCRHCDQPLHYRPDPSPMDPESTDSWWSREDDGSLTSACHGADAVTFDCPGCWGMGVDSDGYDCESCDATGRRADHTPTQVDALSPDARVLSSETDLEAAIAAAEAVGSQTLVEQFNGQLAQVRAERERKRRIRAQRLDGVFAATAPDGAF
jgi:hypothetical protein